MGVSYTTNVKDIIADIQFGARETRPATVRALNRTIDQVKVRASREVRTAGYKLKISDIKAAIGIERASAARLRANARASGRPISLIKYNARQVGAGVSVDVLNGRKTIAHAFIANSKAGTKQVFVREPGAQHRKVIRNGKPVWSALPIRKLFGPSIPDALLNEAVSTALQQYMGERFVVNFEHEHEWLSKRLARRAAVTSD